MVRRSVRSAVVAVLSLILSVTLLPVLIAPAQGAVFDDHVQLLGSVEPVGDLKEGGSSGAALGGRFFFAGYTPATGTELWVTDGTRAGTRMVKDLDPGEPDGYPRDFTTFRGKIYFAASDAFGEEFWVSDGTAAGTRRLKDIRPGDGSSQPTELTVAGARLFFSARGPDGTELWVSDGTNPGTRQVRDLWPGGGSSYPYGITRYGDKVVFAAEPLEEVRKPYVSDGTAAGTYRLDNAGNLDLDPRYFAVVGTRIFFAAVDDGTWGNELWHSSGRPGDALILKDIHSGGGSSFPAYLTPIGNRLVFAATTATHGNELWRTDGTTAGTVQLRDIWPGDGSSYPEAFFRAGDDVYFNADQDQPGGTGDELWVTRGTEGSTRLVADVRPGESDSGAWPLGAAGGRLLFSAYRSETGAELYVTRPGATGARSLGDVNPGAASLGPAAIGRLGGTMLLRVEVGTTVRLAAYTIPVPTVRVRTLPVFSRAVAARRAIRVPVRVAATGIVVTGRVALFRGDRRVGLATIGHGVARVRINVRLAPGRHRLRAMFLGSAQAQSRTSPAFVVRVRAG